MIERSKGRELIINPLKAALVGGLALLTLGCGARRDAGHVSIGGCDSSADFAQKFGNKPISDILELHTDTTDVVKTLHERTEHADGKIAFSNSGNATDSIPAVELESDTQLLRLRLSKNSKDAVWDEVRFKFDGKEPQEIALGALICSEAGKLYPTMTVGALDYALKASELLDTSPK